MSSNEVNPTTEGRHPNATRRSKKPALKDANPPQPAARRHPVLDRLKALYPALFGEVPRPLKRGVFEDLLDRHGEELTADGIKTALALHTRSTRYINALASGQPRHDLEGNTVEPVAPEQRHHAIVEVFRRRQTRSPQNLRPQLRQRIVHAFEASGLGQEAYATLVQCRDESINSLTREALTAAVLQQARELALLRAFEQSGQDLETFASGYGIAAKDAQRMLDRARARR